MRGPVSGQLLSSGHHTLITLKCMRVCIYMCVLFIQVARPDSMRQVAHGGGEGGGWMGGGRHVIIVICAG